MTGIFTGALYGFGRSSAAVLGAMGRLGSAAHGRSGEGVFVNAATGNLILQRQDEFLVGRGPDSAISRTYNSLTGFADDNDDRWRQSTDRRVTLSGTLNSAGSFAQRINGDGTRVKYLWDSTRSAYLSTDGGGAYLTLSNNTTDNEWVWTDGDSQMVERYFYDSTGRIKSQTDTDNYSLTYEYKQDGSGRLDTVTASDGGYFRYVWSGSSQNITEIVTGYKDYALTGTPEKTLTRTRYTYDDSNRLKTVVVDLSPEDGLIADGKVYVTSYDYVGSTNFVSKVTQTDGSQIDIEYDTSNRVKKLTELVTSGASPTTRITQFAYYSGANYTGYTEITDPANRITRLDYDGLGQLTKITAPPAYSSAAQQTVQFEYNDNGDVTKVIDAQGNQTVYSDFTANGLAQTITTSLSTVTRTYDSKNHLLSETTSGIDATGAAVSQIVRYVYDTAGHLRYQISAEGQVTKFTWTNGAVTRITRSQGAAYTASGTPSETDIGNWITANVDPQLSLRTFLTYDGRGNLTRKTEYSAYDSSGGELTDQGVSETNYVYDQAGQLLSAYATGGAATSYLYDGLGRLKSETDANGRTTTYTFDDAATTTTICVASDYTVVKVYNKAGDLLSVTDSAAITSVSGGATQYAYDSLGRVRVTTHPASYGTSTSYKTYTVYDGAGRHVGDVNSDGYLTEYRYDADNRLVGTIHYAVAVTSTELAALADPSNLAPITARPSGTGATASWLVYDAMGRVVETIAGDGSATISTYDAAGRLQRTTSYYNKISATTVAAYITGAAPSALVTPTADAARDIVTRNFYDKDGRLIGRLDGEGYLTRNVYDKAGRLITTTTFATVVPSGNRAAGSFNTLIGLVGTSAGDRTAHYVYDSRNLLRYRIDEVTVGGTAKGQITAYAYADNIDRIAQATVYATYIAAPSDYRLATIKTAAAGIAGTSDRTEYSFYDTAGRLSYTVGAAGAVASYGYDAQGRLTKTIEYAAAWSGSAPTAASVASFAASHASGTGNELNRITRNWFTARDEAAYTVDAEGYVSRNDYDAGGQLVGATRWATPITIADTATFAQFQTALTGIASTSQAWEYDSLGRVKRERDGAGSWTAYVYHGATGLVNTVTRAATGTAQEQAVTTTTYDAAGHAVQTVAAVGTSDATTSTAEYDGRGLLYSATDGRTHTTTYTYDLDGRVKTVTDAAGGVTTYEYNAFGEVWKVTAPKKLDPANPGSDVYVTTHTWYDRLGRAIAVRDGENYLTTTAYTASGEIASVTRWFTPVSGTPAMGTVPAGSGAAATTTFAYDKAGRVESSTDALSHAETYAYDVFGDRVSVTNRLGAVTSYAYDRLGRLTREGVAAATSNLPATGNYDSGHNLVAASAVAGVETVTTYQYDAWGAVKLKIEGYAVTAGGAVTALRTTSYAYDDAGRLTDVTHDTATAINDDMTTFAAAAAPAEHYAYDARGNVIRAIDAGGAATYSYWDDLDRKTAEIRQLTAGTWAYTAYEYDANGNVVTTTVYETVLTATPTLGGTKPSAPTGSSYRQTTFAYDALDRMTSSTVVSSSGNAIVSGSWNGTSYAAAAGNLVTYYQYDAMGNVVKTTDANDNVTWSWYDKLGRKTDQLDAGGYLSHWSYDAEGQVLSETRYATRFTGTPALGTAATVAAHADDRTTEFTYDLTGNRLSESRLAVAAWTLAGTNLTPTADTGASLISYTYNALGQVITKTVAGVQIATYTYDPTGRLTSEARASFADANGNTVTPTTGYAYDALGDLVSSTQAGTASGSYTTQDRVTAYRYGEGGRLLATTDAEGMVHRYFYDAAGRLKQDAYARIVNADTAATTTGTATIAEAQGTTYDLAGRVIGQAVWSTVGGTLTRIGYTSFQYNVFDQVTAQGTGSTSASGMNAGAAAFQAANQYDGAGRLTGTNAQGGVWTFFAYDKTGNRTAAIASAGAAFTSATGFAGALAAVGNANVDGTWTVYDARGLATSVIEEGRDLSASVTGQVLTTARAYTAFGEVASETDALGAGVTYTYNAMGRLTRIESPAVKNAAGIWIRPSEERYYDRAGRLIASRDANGTYGTTANTEGTAYAKDANTGNLTRFVLLAGTGYDGSQALVTSELHADGGVRETLYDRLGDARVIRDELYLAGAPNLHVTEQSFDRLGRLVQVKHNRTTDITGDSTRLIDEYRYDQLGQRIQHTTSVYGSAAVEKTATDALGRVVSQTDAGGHVTATSYAWDGTLATANVGTLGGWVQTTTMANARTLTVKQDLYGRTLEKTDLGAHKTTFFYDAAGRLTEYRDTTAGATGGAAWAFQWLNSGKQGQVTASDGGVTTYAYDKAGRLTGEKLVVGTNTLKDQTASYNALGWVTDWVDLRFGQSAPSAAETHMSYDANGNVVVRASSYRDTAGGTQYNYSDGYGYDVMNRMTADRIYTYAYDKTGNRTWMGTPGSKLLQSHHHVEGGIHYYDREITATFTNLTNYIYDGAGRLERVDQIDRDAHFLNNDIDDTSYVVTDKATVVTGTYGYDLLNRTVSQSDTPVGGTASSRTTQYNELGGATSVTATQGSASTTTAYSYGSGSTYALGQVISATASGSSTQASSYEFAWFDGAVRSKTTTTGTGVLTPGTSEATFDAFGRTTRVDYTGASTYHVDTTYDASNQAIVSEDTRSTAYGDRWSRMGGTLMWNWSVRAGVQGGDPGGSPYTVQAGETLTSIAMRLWGDGALWYKLAEANGLSGDSVAEGIQLRVPSGVWRAHQNAGTFQPYNPASFSGAGEASPLYPTARPHGPKCGVFGQILQAVVTIAVTALLELTPLAPVAPIIGNAAGQLFGMATGIQQGGFNWKSLGMAALTVAVGNPIGGIGGAMVSNAAVQGIGVAVGLQDKFSWAGVAASGVGAAVGTINFGPGIGGQIAATTADVLAQAATRSVIEGSSFGANIIAQLPSAIGNLVGRMAAQGIATAFDGKSGKQNAQGGPGDGASNNPSRGKADTLGNRVSGALTSDYRLDRRRFYGADGAPDEDGIVGSVTYDGSSDIDELVSEREGLSGTVTDDSPWHSTGWKIADAFGLHKGGLLYGLFQGLFSGGADPARVRSSALAITLTKYGGKAASGADLLYRGTIGPGTLPYRLINVPFNAAMGAIANSPFGDLGVITTMETSGVPLGAAAGNALTGVRGYAALVGTAKVADVLARSKALGAIDDPLAAAVAGGRFSGAYTTNGELIGSIATRADDWGIRTGLGEGPITGTAKHGYAENLLDRYQRMFGGRDLTPEVRYVGGRRWREGRPLAGSIRLDVVEGPLANPTRVWDYKFGNATLSQGRITQIQNGIPNGPNVPILMVKP